MLVSFWIYFAACFVAYIQSSSVDRADLPDLDSAASLVQYSQSSFMSVFAMQFSTFFITSGSNVMLCFMQKSWDWEFDLSVVLMPPNSVFDNGVVRSFCNQLNAELSSVNHKSYRYVSSCSSRSTPESIMTQRSPSFNDLDTLQGFHHFLIDIFTILKSVPKMSEIDDSLRASAGEGFTFFVITLEDSAASVSENRPKLVLGKFRHAFIYSTSIDRDRQAISKLIARVMYEKLSIPDPTAAQVFTGTQDVVFLLSSLCASVCISGSSTGEIHSIFLVVGIGSDLRTSGLGLPICEAWYRSNMFTHLSFRFKLVCCSLSLCIPREASVRVRRAFGLSDTVLQRYCR